MYSELEQTLIRELDAVADDVTVPPLPDLPVTAPVGDRWPHLRPMLLVAAVLVVALTTVTALRGLGGDDRDEPAPAPTTVEDDDPVSRAAPKDPVLVGQELYVGGERVPGEWYYAKGTGTRWIGLRAGFTWWWGYDARPQRIDGVSDQPVEISPDGGYQAWVSDDLSLVGSDTEEGGEGFGVELPPEAADSDPAAVVASVSNDGLVVARGSTFQVLYRPLVDGELVDLTETAPGQVVLGSTAAGLIVNEGPLDATDATQGEPYLATLAADGTLTRLGPVPKHDVLVASEEWLAYVPFGTIGGETFSDDELAVQRVDGEDVGTLTAPDGWVFLAPGFQWESDDRLLAPVVTENGDEDGLVRCRPEPASCVLVDLG